MTQALLDGLKDERFPGLEGRQIEIPRLEMRAEFAPNTFNEDDRSVEVVFTAGAVVRRFGFLDGGFGPFDQSLDFSAGAHRDERLLSDRIPVLNAHRREDISDQLGVLFGASLDAATQTGTGRIRFSNRPELEGFIADVREGIVTNLSIGFVIHQNRDVTERADDVRRFLAVDWEIHEVSFVPVGADPGASTRSLDSSQRSDGPTNVCILWQEAAMTPEPRTDTEGSDADQNRAAPIAAPPQPEPAAVPPTPAQPSEDLRAEIRQEERARVSGIRTAARHLGLGADDDFVVRMLEGDVTLDAARAAMIERVGAMDSQPSNEVSGHSGIEVGEAEGEKIGRAVENALLCRINPGRWGQTTEQRSELQGNPYVHMTLLELGKDLLERHGLQTRGLSKHEVCQTILSTRRFETSGPLMVTRGAHSTSDFPGILANIANKELRAAYEETPDTWSQWARRGTLSDFKVAQRPALGASPALLEKIEGAEYQWGTAGEEDEPIQLVEYGRVISFTRQAMINDDLDAFSRIPQSFGSRARDLIADLVYDIINTNPNMADGNAVFSAAHNNLVVPGSVLSIAGLSDLRELMRTQVGIPPGDGEAGQIINVPPRHLRVPAALETEAAQFTTQITPQAAGDVNPFVGVFQTVAAEPRLDPTSTTAYFAFGPTSLALIEVAFLQGEDGPVTETRTSFNTDSVDLKVRQTVGVSPIESRGAAMNDGTP